MANFLDLNGLNYFLTKIKEIFINDAPVDDNVYGRKNNEWVIVEPTFNVEASVEGNTLILG